MTAAGWGIAAPRPEPWRDGPWALVRAGDELADLRFEGRPLLRSVRAVVRDRDWRTVPPTVESVQQADGALTLRLRFHGLGADLRGDLTVSATSDRLAIGLALRSHSTFGRNRIGLVVLHAAELAGTDLTIEHPDSSRSTIRLPVDIAPHQPALDISALSWSAHGVLARLAFDGDVFEMEDQRNWTDASFKTYSTPLDQPFPVRLQEGDEIRQRIDLTCETVGDDALRPEPETIELTRRGDHLPAFTLGATTAAGPLPRTDDRALLVELEAERPGWREVLARAADEAGAAGLDVRIIAEGPAAVRAVVDEVVHAPDRIRRVGIFSPTTHRTEPLIWAALRDRAAETGLAAELLGGTRAHFTELNRGHASLPPDLPALAFSSTPQMHAVESRQLVESIAMQRLTAQNAVRIAGGRPVHIGPITLRPRFNAVATSAPGGVDPDSADQDGADQDSADPDSADPRQSSTALAAWTIASAAAVSVPGVATASWFEASGPRGLRSLQGVEFPVAGAMRQILGLSGADAMETSAAPTGVHVLAGCAGGTAVALIANLRDDPVAVGLRFGGREHRVTIPPLEHRRCEWPASQG